jgi:valyl-tRNA synthetase
MASRNLCNKVWNISRLVQDIVDNNPTETDKVEIKNLGEDWICEQINNTNKELQKLMENYRFAEAGDLIYDLIWNKYADWFIETEKLWKNTNLLKNTLEKILTMLHPFAPFVTETIWQTLSWTEGMLITQTWPTLYSANQDQADKYSELIEIITNIRSHYQNIPGANNYPIAFRDDPLMYDNQLLVQHLTKSPCVPKINAEDAAGLHLAIHNHNIYIQIPKNIHDKYKANLEDRILKMGQEITTLEKRLESPNYVTKAPKELVEETRKSLTDKKELLEKAKAELELI